jgi:hypothetical protein
MQVVIDMFSGRPNPTWELEPTEADHLRSAIGRLRPCPEAQPPEALGYRGFVLLDESPPQRTIVYRGTVWSYSEKGLTCLQDEGHAVERILLSGAQTRLAPELYPLLLQLVGQAPS